MVAGYSETEVCCVYCGNDWPVPSPASPTDIETGNDG